MKTIGKWLRHPFVLMLIVFCLLCVYFVGTIRSSNELNEHRHASVVYDYNYHFAIDVGDLDSNISDEFVRGAYESADALGVALEINGLNSSFNETSIDFFTWASYVRPDGIITNRIVESGDAQKVISANIPYCTVYNYPSRDGEMYVGPNNYAQGQELAAALGEKYSDADLYIALLYDANDGIGAGSRLRGFIDGAKQFPGLHIMEVRAVEPGVLRGMGVAEDIMLSFGEINYFVCLDEVLLSSTVRGIIDLNRVNMVMVSGIGYSEAIDSYIESNIIDFAIKSDGYEMGKEAVQKLYRYKQKELEQDALRTLLPYEIVGDGR